MFLQRLPQEVSGLVQKAGKDVMFLQLGSEDGPELSKEPKETDSCLFGGDKPLGCPKPNPKSFQNGLSAFTQALGSLESDEAELEIKEPVDEPMPHRTPVKTMRLMRRELNPETKAVAAQGWALEAASVAPLEAATVAPLEVANVAPLEAAAPSGLQPRASKHHHCWTQQLR